MKESSVIVIGGGLAGMMAAIAAHDGGAEVILVDRGSVGIGTNSALANGVFSGPSSRYSVDEYIRDTFESGRMLNYEPVVRIVAKEAQSAFDSLRSLGVVIEQTGISYHTVRPPRPEIIPGFALVKMVADAVRRLSRVRIFGGFYVTELVGDHQGVRGVKGLSADGREMSIHGTAVILATGGGGAIYEMHDNQRNMMGQGYRLAAMAGVQLWDMEFVQFIPVVLAEPNTPRMLLFSPFPAGTRLINEAGEDLANKYDMVPLNDAVRKRRDDLSICLFEESKNGAVYIDYRNVPSSAWAMHPLALLSGVNFDFRNKPARILPGAHFFNGGIRVTGRGQTVLPGLFACGEIVWGLHGANRRGGNALTECVVFGQAAGRAAADCRTGHRFAIEEHWPKSKGQVSPGRLKELRVALRKLAWEKVGIIRDGVSMLQALDEVTCLGDCIHEAHAADLREILLREDLLSACFVLKAILTASLARKESRGCFSRRDYPNEDKDLWLKNSCLSYRPETAMFAIDHCPSSGLVLESSSRSHQSPREPGDEKAGN